MNIKRDSGSGVFYIDVEGERLWVSKTAAAERLSFPMSNMRVHQTGFGNLVLIKEEGSVLHSYTRFPPIGHKVSIISVLGEIVLERETPIPLSNRNDLGVRVLIQSKGEVELIVEIKGPSSLIREKVLINHKGEVSEFPEDEELLKLLNS